MLQARSTDPAHDAGSARARGVRGWRKWAIRGGLGLGALIAGLAGAAALFQLAASGVERARLTPPGKLVRVGDHSLYVHCTGDGDGPTVVLENGMGVVSEAWTHIQMRLSTRYRVCAYDRMGTGWSPAAAGPSDAGTAADDLAVLLEAKHIAAPIVLAGHSYGGVIARVFAARHPDKLSGIVLVDSAHEDMGERLPPEAQEGLRQLLASFGQMRVLNVLRAPASWA